MGLDNFRSSLSMGELDFFKPGFSRIESLKPILRPYVTLAPSPVAIVYGNSESAWQLSGGNRQPSHLFFYDKPTRSYQCDGRAVKCRDDQLQSRLEGIP